MKATENFKKVIQNHLEASAQNDPLFAETLKKEGKNIDDCITYILNTVKDSGCNGFSDEEIFGMATHYYDEDDIKVGGKIKGKVIVNHHVELSAAEIQDIKQKALDDAYKEQRANLLAKKRAKAPTQKQDPKPAQTLF